MAGVNLRDSAWRGAGLRTTLLFWIMMELPPSLPQPPLPPSLPVDMAVTPQGWSLLPLSQAELGPLFSNSSPFSSSQSLFIAPPHRRSAPASLRASFGPYSVTQLIPEPSPPPHHLLSASLLSDHVEREADAKGEERFTVRVLFHTWGDAGARRTCVALHAFKDTEEHGASCMTQPPLGLCVVTLALPGDWFAAQRTNQSNQVALSGGHLLRHQHRRRHGYPGNRRQKPTPRLRPRHEHSSAQERIQLYYSSSSMTVDLDLEPRGCVEGRTAPSQQQLIPIRAVTLRASGAGAEVSGSRDTCLSGQEVEELSLDADVLIRYRRGLVPSGQPAAASVNLGADLRAKLVVVRLKVKKNLVSIAAQRPLTSDLWDVTLERSQGPAHDVVSVLCRRRGGHKHPHNPPPLHQAACLRLDALKGSFGVAMAVQVDWWVEYSDHDRPATPSRAAATTFSFTDRQIFGIAPIAESNSIINTAILTNQPVSLAVTVLAVGRDGRVYDVTSAAACWSADENIVKVSSNCSAVFVDGSEAGLGSTCARVEFVLGSLRGSVCLEVWAPSVPLQVSLSDPILNAINGWSHASEAGCVPVYQRSSVQVLTQFTARDPGGRTVHLLGSPDWSVDVTGLVLDLLRVEDPRVASFGPQKNIIGLQPGKTSLRVISEQWDGILGGCEVTVTSEPVNPGDLSVQVVSELGMLVTASPAHPFIATATVTAYNVLYNQHQEASVNTWLQFSDDSASLLSAFADLPHFLSLSSLAETVVAAPPGQGLRVFARGDGGGPLLFAELLVPTCGGGGTEPAGTRMLAKGSGWIRVNLDLGFLPKAAGGGEFDVDVSDVLVESNGDLYGTSGDKSRRRNASRDYRGQQGGDRDKTVYGNHLERTVQMAGKEEGAVYFSSSHEKKRGWEGATPRQEDAPDLEVGLGAVLSLLGIFALLFLANCLPSTLRGGRSSKPERVGGPELAGAEAGGGERTEGEDGRQREEGDGGVGVAC